VVTQRIGFWSILASDQGRAMDNELAARPMPVGIAAAELTACLDALIGNVFAHTPQGAGFSVRLGPLAGGGALLSVTDTGPGFADADLVRRGASGSHSTGLGLDIARQAAEASGGTLTIQPGNGGRVVVELGPPQPGS
jgi:signal transduction histidine kinase